MEELGRTGASRHHAGSNVDPDEVARFGTLAATWWDPTGQLRTLHAINPARVEFIARSVELAGARVVDVGCGGGLLTEALAARGARVSGVDASSAAIAVADLHRHESGAEVEYRVATAEQLAVERPGEFDVVTCLELLEHVPDPRSLIAACAALAAPGGTVFFSTINRNAKAWAMAVLGAEHLLGLLPRGTHEYARFLRPSELDDGAREAGLELMELCGLAYSPLTGSARLVSSVAVNYLARYRCADE